MYQPSRLLCHFRVVSHSKQSSLQLKSLGLWTTESRSFSALSGSTHYTSLKRAEHCQNQQSNKSELLSRDFRPLSSSRGAHSWDFYVNKYMSSDFPPIAYAQQVLESVHDFSGLPWWASIIVTSFAVRTLITLPLSIYSAHVVARVQNLAPEIKQLAQELKAEVDHASQQRMWSEQVARYQYRINLKRLIKELYIRDNCHPFKASIVAWVQLPMWFSFSLALRNMSGSLRIAGAKMSVLCPDLADQGILWFPNLLFPETTYILPVAICVSNLLILEMQSWRAEKPGKLERALTTVFRGISLLIIPIGGIVPSCMSLYWASSTFYGLAQNLALKHPKVRQFFRIPVTPKDSATPYKDMIFFAKLKYTRFFRKSNGADKT